MIPSNKYLHRTQEEENSAIDHFHEALAEGKFSTDKNKPGFAMTFSNGWTVSIQWAGGNYCSNTVEENAMECTDAEIAAWDTDGHWYAFESDNVKGHQSTDQVLEFMNLIRGMNCTAKNRCS
jgi:hypothetical protein